jgi:hypothetical protein
VQEYNHKQEHMSDDTFKMAYNELIETWGEERFKYLQPSSRTALIYAEMRRIDQERAKTAPPPPPLIPVKRRGASERW